jgi:hypothetical protein
VKLVLCVAALGLVVYGYTLMFAAGGWPLVLTFGALSAGAQLLLSASARIQG